MEKGENGTIATVLCTCPAERAGELSRAVVEGRLAACVNIVPEVTSVYRWKGELCEDRESLLIIKTASGRVEELTRRLVELHPYDVPEVIAFEVGEGNPDYIQWVLESSFAGRNKTEKGPSKGPVNL